MAYGFPPVGGGYPPQQFGPPPGLPQQQFGPPPGSQFGPPPGGDMYGMPPGPGGGGVTPFENPNLKTRGVMGDVSDFAWSWKGLAALGGTVATGLIARHFYNNWNKDEGTNNNTKPSAEKATEEDATDSRTHEFSPPQSRDGKGSTGV